MRVPQDPLPHTLALVLLLLGTSTLWADIWDVGTSPDNNSSTTRNELFHGTQQLHDLAALPGPAIDPDWFLVSRTSYSSYEVVVDSTDWTTRPVLERLGLDGTTVLGTGSPLSSNSFASSLRWAYAEPFGLGLFEFIRVQSPMFLGGCSNTCTARNVYRIRMYDTTASLSRFNNTGTQLTVLLLQNPSFASISGTIYFWSPSGTLLASQALLLDARASVVVSTSAIPGVGGTSGSITISHTGRYGELAGKAVALEPSTGFSFDTPLAWLPH